jgi:hypothetical protein
LVRIINDRDAKKAMHPDSNAPPLNIVNVPVIFPMALW